MSGYGDQCLFIGNQLSYYDILTKDNINLLMNSLDLVIDIMPNMIKL